MGEGGVIFQTSNGAEPQHSQVGSWKDLLFGSHFMPPSGKSPVEVSRTLLWLWTAAGFGFGSEEKGFIGGASGSSMYTRGVGHSSIFLSKSPCS